MGDLICRLKNKEKNEIKYHALTIFAGDILKKHYNELQNYAHCLLKYMLNVIHRLIKDLMK